MHKSLLYLGSVKNLYEAGNDIIFEFTDRYSVFDWGEMPDLLDKKGESLASMGALFFKLMSQADVPHHFISLVDEHGLNTPGPSRYMKVKRVNVTRPALTSNGYDYSFFATRPQDGLVPLEVMFRFGVGAGSSLLPRVKKDPGLLKQWNLTSLKEGDLFDFPLIDFSTKLEKGDRYLTFAEAKEIAGLSEKEFTLLTSMTRKVAMLLKDTMNQLGIELWDGKIEWSFTSGQFNPDGTRSFMLVDSIGLDELRLEQRGKSLSKEMLREHYRQSAWFRALSEAKTREGDFKQLTIEAPEALPHEIKVSAENLYKNFTNELSYLVTGRPMFKETLK